MNASPPSHAPSSSSSSSMISSSSSSSTTEKKRKKVLRFINYNPKERRRHHSSKVELSKEKLEKVLNMSQPKAAQALDVSVSTIKRRFHELQMGERWPHMSKSPEDEQGGGGVVVGDNDHNNNNNNGVLLRELKKRVEQEKLANHQRLEQLKHLVHARFKSNNNNNNMHTQQQHHHHYDYHQQLQDAQQQQQQQQSMIMYEQAPLQQHQQQQQSSLMTVYNNSSDGYPMQQQQQQPSPSPSPPPSYLPSVPSILSHQTTHDHPSIHHHYQQQQHHHLHHHHVQHSPPAQHPFSPQVFSGNSSSSSMFQDSYVSCSSPQQPYYQPFHQQHHLVESSPSPFAIPSAHHQSGEPYFEHHTFYSSQMSPPVMESAHVPYRHALALRSTTPFGIDSFEAPHPELDEVHAPSTPQEPMDDFRHEQYSKASETYVEHEKKHPAATTFIKEMVSPKQKVPRTVPIVHIAKQKKTGLADYERVMLDCAIHVSAIPGGRASAFQIVKHKRP